MNPDISSIRHSQESQPYCCVPQSGVIFLALGIIVASGASIAGFLGMHQIAFFGAIGSIGSQALAYGGISLLGAIIVLQLVAHYCSQKKTDPVPETKTIDTTPVPIPVEKKQKPERTFTYPPLLDLIEQRRNALPNFRKGRDSSLPSEHSVLPEKLSQWQFSKSEYDTPMAYGAIAEEPMLVLREILVEMEHPSQMATAISFMQQKYVELLALLEGLKSRAKNAEVFANRFSPVYQTIETSQQELAILSQIVSICQNLLDLSQKDFLDDADMDLLNSLNSLLPARDEPFYPTYSSLIQQLLYALKALSDCPMKEDSESNHYRIWAEIMGKLKIDIPCPEKPKLLFLRTTSQFLSCLTEQIKHLLTYREEEHQSFILNDLRQIIVYLQDEIERFNDVMTDNPFQLDHQPLSFETMWGPLNHLELTWDLIYSMMNIDEIDLKIQVLQIIAERLPNNEIWNQCSLIREFIERLLSTGIENFEHQFISINPEDQKRQAAIEEAYKTINEKLGCKVLIIPKIIMDTSEDASQQVSDANEVFEEAATEIQAIYNQNASISHEFAVEQVVANLQNRVSGLSSIGEQSNYMLEILMALKNEALSVPIMQALGL